MVVPYDSLFSRLGYAFADLELVRMALTHRSVGAHNNERLEFLGDSLLNCVIAAELFRLRPELPEGDLSRLRATLVRGTTLADVAAELELPSLLIMGPGELRSGGFQRQSIQADAVEALLGAVFLDGGFAACQNVVLTLFADRLASLPAVASLKDPKTRLQEWLQGRGEPLPRYELVASVGKSHERIFTVRCEIEAAGVLSEATGTSRKNAEQTAAEGALKMLASKGKGASA